VYSSRGQYVCIYDPKDNKVNIYPCRLGANRDAVEITMTYEGIEYAIRAGLGRNEWVLLISFPDDIGGNPSLVNFSGARNDALAEAKKRIDNGLRRREEEAGRCILAA
jgi:hypothetical protein